MIPFEVGQRVVCVNATNTNTRQVQELVEGKIYTIRWIGPHRDWTSGAENICVRLNEIPGRFFDDPLGWIETVIDLGIMTPDQVTDYITDMPFLAIRFRPLQKKSTKTDISVFKKILDKTPKKAKELV